MRIISVCLLLIKNWDNLIKLFNEELDKVAKWLEIKKLSLNVTITHSIVFFPNRQKLPK